MDVDLVGSTRDVLTHLWPRLSRGGVVLSHDGHLQPVCDLLADPGLGRARRARAAVWVGMGTQKVIYAYKT